MRSERSASIKLEEKSFKDKLLPDENLSQPVTLTTAGTEEGPPLVQSGSSVVAQAYLSYPKRSPKNLLSFSYVAAQMCLYGAHYPASSSSSSYSALPQEYSAAIPSSTSKEEKQVITPSHAMTSTHLLSISSYPLGAGSAYYPKSTDVQSTPSGAEASTPTTDSHTTGARKKRKPYEYTNEKIGYFKYNGIVIFHGEKQSIKSMRDNILHKKKSANRTESSAEKQLFRDKITKHKIIMTNVTKDMKRNGKMRYLILLAPVFKLEEGILNPSKVNGSRERKPVGNKKYYLADPNFSEQQTILASLDPFLKEFKPNTDKQHFENIKAIFDDLQKPDSKFAIPFMQGIRQTKYGKEFFNEQTANLLAHIGSTSFNLSVHSAQVKTRSKRKNEPLQNERTKHRNTGTSTATLELELATSCSSTSLKLKEKSVKDKLLPDDDLSLVVLTTAGSEESSLLAQCSSSEYCNVTQTDLDDAYEQTSSSSSDYPTLSQEPSTPLPSTISQEEYILGASFDYDPTPTDIQIASGCVESKDVPTAVSNTDDSLSSNISAHSTTTVNRLSSEPLMGVFRNADSYISDPLLFVEPSSENLGP